MPQNLNIEKFVLVQVMAEQMLTQIYVTKSHQ